MQPTATENGETKKKPQRTHHRSPAYPMINLEQAIERARLIYNGDKRSLTSRAVILKHLGYKDESSGVGNREVSALKQYGLLEEQSGQYKISDRAYAILFLSEASEEKRTNLSDAALTPTIFRELWGRYGSDASDATLKDYLIHSKNFNPASVSDVVENYRSTIEFAKPTGTVYTGEDESESDQDGGEMNVAPPALATPAAHNPPPRQPEPPKNRIQELSDKATERIMQARTRQDVFSLTEGPVTIQWPATLSAESFEDLGDWLDIVKRKIGRSVANKPVNFGDRSMYTDKE